MWKLANVDPMFTLSRVDTDFIGYAHFDVNECFFSSIPPDYSSDDDSSSSTSSTASNEVVEEVLGQNFQLQEIEGYQFQPRFQSSNDESGD